VGVEVAGDLTIRSRQKWTSLQNKYRLEDAQTEPMISLIANDNWAEYTLRYVVGYKRRRITKSELFTRILTEIETTNGAVKMASATFQLVQAPDFNVNVKTITGLSSIFATDYLEPDCPISIGSKVTPYGKLNTDTPIFSSLFYFRDFNCLFPIVQLSYTIYNNIQNALS
jgi:hypothetical protein